MKRSFSLRMILAACVTMGLLMAPAGVSAISKSADMASSVEMTGGMTCCPDAADHKMPQGGGCKDCPLMAICSLTTMQAFPATEIAAGFHPVLLASMSATDDRVTDGLVGSPPARPPRSLV